MSHESINNFTVAIKIRNNEKSQPTIHRLHSPQQITIDPSHNDNTSSQYTSRQKKFNFDYIFEKSSNKDIFQEIIKPKLSILKENYNLMVMAYGITGSGKTYTVFGNAANPQCQQLGISILSFRHLIQDLLPTYRFRFSYFQVYNEAVNDLLVSPKQDEDGNMIKLKSLNVLEDFGGKVQIPELAKIPISSFEEVCELILQGNSLRKSSATFINKLSSRSHALLQLECTDPETMLTTTFTVIDLAGSQKSFYSILNKKMKATLQQEGSNINKSLLALGNCIQNLERGENYIPYRDSKLTRIIKEELSGNSQNIMIACINPSVAHSDETLNTLNYAAKASKIKLQVKKIEKSSHYQCEHCMKTIPWQKIPIPPNYTTKTIEKRKPQLSQPTFTFFEIHKMMQKMRLQIEEQVQVLKQDSIDDMSVLFTQTRNLTKSAKSSIRDIVEFYESEILRLFQTKQKGKPSKSTNLRVNISVETLENEKQMILKDSKEKEGNVRKKISIRENEVGQGKLLTKTQRMNRDVEEDTEAMTKKESMMRKLEIAQRRLNQIEVSPFDPSF